MAMIVVGSLAVGERITSEGVVVDTELVMNIVLKFLITVSCNACVLVIVKKHEVEPIASRHAEMSSHLFYIHERKNSII